MSFALSGRHCHTERSARRPCLFFLSLRSSCSKRGVVFCLSANKQKRNEQTKKIMVLPRKSLWSMVGYSWLALLLFSLRSAHAQETIGFLLDDEMVRRALGAKTPKAPKTSMMKKHNMGGSMTSQKTSPPQPTDPPAGVPLDNFPQWQAEVGYWVGEYSCK